MAPVSQPANPPTWLDSAGNTWIIHQQACHRSVVHQPLESVVPAASLSAAQRAGWHAKKQAPKMHSSSPPPHQPAACHSAARLKHAISHAEARQPPPARSLSEGTHSPASQQPGISLPDAASTITDKPTIISTPCCACMYTQVQHACITPAPSRCFPASPRPCL
jgi:hypothetical protein